MSHYYRCIIVDDEPKAVEMLQDSIGEIYPNIEIAGTYNNWQDALNAIRNTAHDILFLDISMPGKTGLDLLQLLPRLDSEVIFVTAHANYAVDAFSLSASGYVLKPVKDELLVKAIDTALTRIANKRDAQKPKANSPKRLGIPNNKGIDYLNIDEILYLEATQRYTKIQTTKVQMLSSYSIGRFKELLPAEIFFQPHRSYVINLAQVVRYEAAGNIIMSDGLEVPVSKNMREDFLAIFIKIEKEAGDSRGL